MQREVLSSWRDHQSIKALSVRREMGPYFCLRQRMLHFLQNFVYYMTVEVIKPRDHEMQVGLSSARDMDEVSFCDVKNIFLLIFSFIILIVYLNCN